MAESYVCWTDEITDCRYPYDAWKLCVSHLGSIAGARSVALFFPDQSKRKLVLAASWNLDTGPHLHGNESLVLTAMSEEDPLRASVFSGQPRFAKVVDLAPQASMRMFSAASGPQYSGVYPLKGQSGIIGWMYFIFDFSVAMLPDLVHASCCIAALCLEGLHEGKRAFVPSKANDSIWETAEYPNVEMVVAEHLHGRSPAIAKVRKDILPLVSLDVPVLIVGELGAGKTLAAETLHNASLRKHFPLRQIVCDAQSPEWLQSQLFGHVRNSSPVATSDYVGLLRTVGEGTLVLEEVDALPLDLQAKLVNVLETRRFNPVGSMDIFETRARIVATTRKDPKQLESETRFSQSLFYKLAVYTLSIPPLRNRMEDVPILAEALLPMVAPGFSLSPSAICLLANQTFPDNVAGLRNMLSRAASLAGAPCELTPEFLFPLEDSSLVGSTLPALLRSVEEKAISSAVAKCGNVVQAARILGVPASTLRSKIDRLQ